MHVTIVCTKPIYRPLPMADIHRFVALCLAIGRNHNLWRIKGRDYENLGTFSSYFVE